LHDCTVVRGAAGGRGKYYPNSVGELSRNQEKAADAGSGASWPLFSLLSEKSFGHALSHAVLSRRIKSPISVRFFQHKTFAKFYSLSKPTHAFKMSSSTIGNNTKESRLLALLHEILDHKSLPYPTLVFLAMLAIPTNARRMLNLRWPEETPATHEALCHAILECWLPTWSAYTPVCVIESPDWSQLDKNTAQDIYARLNQQFPPYPLPQVRLQFLMTSMLSNKYSRISVRRGSTV
jgi:hypothetical protein